MFVLRFNEKINNYFKDIDFYSGIMEGLEEALAYEKGKAKIATIVRKRNLPNINVAEQRSILGLTQKGFAKILGVSPRTVELGKAAKATLHQQL